MPRGVNFIMNKVIFIITSSAALNTSISKWLGFSLILVIKKPKSIAKKIIASICPCASAWIILVGTMLIKVFPKLSEAAAIPSTGVLNPNSAPTPGFMVVTRIKPVTMATRVEIT
jgi:hypothetical protein